MPSLPTAPDHALAPTRRQMGPTPPSRRARVCDAALVALELLVPAGVGRRKGHRSWGRPRGGGRSRRSRAKRGRAPPPHPARANAPAGTGRRRAPLLRVGRHCRAHLQSPESSSTAVTRIVAPPRRADRSRPPRRSRPTMQPHHRRPRDPPPTMNPVPQGSGMADRRRPWSRRRTEVAALYAPPEGAKEEGRKLLARDGATGREALRRAGAAVAPLGHLAASSLRSAWSHGSASAKRRF
ncbi:unnamed protein product [Urochloa humidicola]